MLVLQVQLDLKAALAPEETLAHQDNQEALVLLDLREQQDLLVYKDLKGFEAILVLKDHQVPLVYLDLQDHLDRKDPQASLDHKEQQVQ